MQKFVGIDIVVSLLFNMTMNYRTKYGIGIDYGMK